MKCTNCGKNEVNFHYSSNVNGCVTEADLCAQCAAEQGYDMRGLFGNSLFFGADSEFERMLAPIGVRLFDAASVFNGFFPVFGQLGGWTDGQRGGQAPLGGLSCGCGSERGNGNSNGNVNGAASEAGAQVDGEMAKRREINALREQMRTAAQKDDFEKAIELRERIKEMEG